MKPLIVFFISLVLLAPVSAQDIIVLRKRAVAAGGSFPVSSLLDNFDRADNADLGANWTPGLRSGNNALQLSTNQVSVSTGGLTSGEHWSTTTFGPDTEIYVTINGITDGADGMRACGRIANPGTGSVSGYCVTFEDISGAANDTVDIQRLDTNSLTVLGATITQEFDNGDAIGVWISGSNITVYRCASGGSCGVSGAGWTALGSRTDSTYSAAGYIGISIGGGTLDLDNFGGGTH